MTKEELLKKNAAIELARKLKKEQELAQKELESKRVDEVEIKEEPTAIVKEEIKEEQPKKKKGGRKPANRQYMVVDNVGISEEAAEDAE